MSGHTYVQSCSPGGPAQAKIIFYFTDLSNGLHSYQHTLIQTGPCCSELTVGFMGATAVPPLSGAENLIYSILLATVIPSSGETCLR